MLTVSSCVHEQKIKDYEASGVLFCEPIGTLGLTIFLPNKKEGN